MPAAYQLDPAHRVVWSRAWGVLTDGHLLEHQALLRVDPAFTPDFDQLFDFLDVTENCLTAAGIRTLASRNAFGAGARRAFVVRQTEVYGMMRMFEILTSDHPDELRVIFHSLALARHWLGLPDPDDAAA